MHRPGKYTVQIARRADRIWTGVGYDLNAVGRDGRKDDLARGKHLRESERLIRGDAESENSR